MLGLFGDGFTLSLEESGQTRKSQRFPLAYLVGVDAILRSELRYRLLFFDGFLNDFGFESRRVLFSHGVLSLTYFFYFSCPDSWYHYIQSALAQNEIKLPDLMYSETYSEIAEVITNISAERLEELRSEGEKWSLDETIQRILAISEQE